MCIRDRPLPAYHLKVNKALREYADAFGRAFDEQQALFQYWHGLTNLRPTNGWSRLCASTIRRQRRDRHLRKSCDMHSRMRRVMTLPIIMEDIQDRGISLTVVAMATKAKAEPERARSEAPALLFCQIFW